MANIIEEFLISIGVKSDGVKKGMKEVESSISGSISSIKSMLGGLSTAITAAFSVGMAFNQYAQEADSLGKMARAVEMNVSEFHAFAEATALAGGSADAFQGTIRHLSGQLTRIASTGTGRIKGVLESYGVDAGDLNRERKALDVLMDISAVMQDMSKSEQLGLAEALGIDFGTMNFIAEGPQKIKDTTHAIKEQGVATERDVQLAETFNDGMQTLGRSFRYVSAIIFRQVLPSINKMIDYFTKAFVFLQKHERFVQLFFKGLAAVITTVAIPALLKLSKAFLTNPITWFVAAVAGLALALDDMFGWMEGKNAALGDFWAKLFGTDDPEEAKKKWEDLKKSVSEFVDKLSELPPKAQDIFKTFEQVNNFILSPIRLTIQAVQELIEIFDKINQFVISPLKLTVKAVNELKAAFETLSNIISDMFTSALEKAKSVWDNTIGSIKMPSFGSMLPGVSASDGISGSSGNTDNSNHEVTMNNTYNVTSSDPEGVMTEIDFYQRQQWANQANVGVTG